jgi:hypothetical protein
MLEGLRKKGFQLTFGDQDSGVMPLWLNRGGGYYFSELAASIYTWQTLMKRIGWKTSAEVKPSQMVESS